MRRDSHQNFSTRLLRHLPAVRRRAASVADRRQRALEDPLHTLDGGVVPELAGGRVLGLEHAHGRGRDAAEREARAPHAAARVAIDRHGGRDRADVVEPALGHLVEAQALRERLRDLDRVRISPGWSAVRR